MGMLILVYMSIYILNTHALSALFWTHISVYNHNTDMHGRLGTMLFHWSSGCLHLIRLFWSWCLWPIWSWWMVSNCFELHLHKATWNRTVRTVSIIAHAASLDAQLRGTVHDLLFTIMQLHLRVWAVLTHCDWNYQFGRCSIGFKTAVLKLFWKGRHLQWF